MVKKTLLVEIEDPRPSAFESFSEAAGSPLAALRQSESLAGRVSGLGIEIVTSHPPVPMFSGDVVRGERGLDGFASFVSSEINPDQSASSVVLQVEIDTAQVDELLGREGIRVFDNPRLRLIDDLAGVSDCRPFRPAVTGDVIQWLLEVEPIWNEGFTGAGVAVGILDAGVDGSVYPVVDGFAGPGAMQPGAAPITSHGSMCAADVLISAPDAVIYDYPFLKNPLAGDALLMLQMVLERRRRDGTPHLVTNSWGLISVPAHASNPTSPVWDLDHPLHRKIREVVASGAPVFFAAGNCGLPCPSASCLESSIGPGRSIHSCNSLVEVITVAAVNSDWERIGYSSQGPGMFERRKPDISAYSHFFGNFGPGRPGGTSRMAFDNGTSAAAPVAAGVAALLISAFGPLNGDQMKEALIASAGSVGVPGWTPETGFGVINGKDAFQFLARSLN